MEKSTFLFWWQLQKLAISILFLASSFPQKKLDQAFWFAPWVRRSGLLPGSGVLVCYLGQAFCFATWAGFLFCYLGQVFWFATWIRRSGLLPGSGLLVLYLVQAFWFGMWIRTSGLVPGSGLLIWYLDQAFWFDTRSISKSPFVNQHHQSEISAFLSLCCRELFRPGLAKIYKDA